MSSTSLFPSFVREFAAFDDAAWRRVADRVHHLSGDSAKALLARGDAVAQGLPPGIPSILRSVLGVAHAVYSEFPGTGGVIPTPSQIANSRLPRAQHAAVQASAALATLLEARRPEFPGVVACAEAVIPLLIAPHFYSPEQREALYAPFEPDLPFATLSTRVDFP